MALDQQWWRGSGGGNEVLIRWRIVERMRSAPVLRRKLDRARLRDVAYIDRDIAYALQLPERQPGRVEFDDRRRLHWRAADEDCSSLIPNQPVDAGVRTFYTGKALRFRVEQAEANDAGVHDGTSDGFWSNERVARRIETPERSPDLSFEFGQRRDLAAAQCIEVPPPRSLGDEGQLPVGRPARLKDAEV